MDSIVRYFLIGVIYIYFSNAIYGQVGNPGKVYVEDNYRQTESEKERIKLEQELSNISGEMRKALDSYNHEIIQYRNESKTYIDEKGVKRLKTFQSQKEINEYELKVAQFERQMMAKYNLISLKEDIVQVERKLGREVTNNWIVNAEKLDNRINDLSYKIKNEINTKSEEIAENRQHEVEMQKMDQEIAELDRMLEDYSDSNDSRDELGNLDQYFEKNSGLGDNKESVDIFDDMNEVESADIFEDLNHEENTNKNYKIDIKGNIQGVISNNGKVLIPYKEWKIEEYKMGLAKVSQTVDTYSYDCGSYNINKVGFVDKEGKFLDFKYDFLGGGFYEDYQPRLALYVSNSNDSPQEQAAAERRRKIAAQEEKRARELRNKKCKLNSQNALSYLKSKYKN